MRVLAIGDIHGCLLQFNDLLNLVKPAPGDQLVLLGDYVDRGPDSRGVLDRILELKRSCMNLVCLRGNHEIMMLAARDGGVDLKTWLGIGGSQTLGSYGPSSGRSGSVADIPDRHWHLLEDELVDYHETAEHIFVHAGADPNDAMDDQMETWLFWEKLRDDMRHVSGKPIICGHTSQKSGEIKTVPGAVCIDTYAYGGGWLTCLDALSGRYWQVNFMGKPREGHIDFEE